MPIQLDWSDRHDVCFVTKLMNNYMPVLKYVLAHMHVQPTSIIKYNWKTKKKQKNNKKDTEHTGKYRSEI